MKAIILAAGRGSRMKEKTNDRPKCMVELKGRSLLEWQLTTLKKAGIKDIAIVTGYKRELISVKAPFEFHNERWAETNMLSSLACAKEWLVSEPCIVSYSDIFYDVSAVKSLMNSDDDLAITYDPNWLDLWSKRFDDPLSDAETFILNLDNTICEIGNKAGSLDEIEGQYMGLIRFSPKGWEEAERIRQSVSLKEKDQMHMTGLLQRIIISGNIHVKAISFDGVWGEVDTQSDLAVYHLSE